MDMEMDVGILAKHAVLSIEFMRWCKRMKPIVTS